MIELAKPGRFLLSPYVYVLSLLLFIKILKTKKVTKYQHELKAADELDTKPDKAQWLLFLFVTSRECACM